jgi:hypothetical protein
MEKIVVPPKPTLWLTRDGHHGRVTDKGFINPNDIIAIVKRRQRRALADGLTTKNPPVPAGTRRTDVRHAICKSCMERKLIGAMSGECNDCFWGRMEEEVDTLAAETQGQREQLEEQS